MNQLFESIHNSAPVLKWPGRKTKLLKPLKVAIKNIGYQPDLYVEPFFGSGAVFFMLKNEGLIHKSNINDYLKELEIFYKTLKNKKNLDIFFSKYTKLIRQYNSQKSTDDRKEFYNKKRNSYNSLLSSINSLNNEERVNLSSHLFFLNKTGFNGVYRKNSKGQYNVPHGRRAGSSQKIKFDFKDKENLKNLSNSLKNTKITSGDFSSSLFGLTRNDFVFFDPPYVENFVDYSEKGFDSFKSVELSKALKQLKEKSVSFLMTNSNTEKTKEIFFNKDLFCYELEVTRTIERRKNNNSGRITEILVSSYKIDGLGKSIW